MFLMFSRISAFDPVLILTICSSVYSLIFTILSMYAILVDNMLTLCFGVKVFPMQRSPAIQNKQPFVEKSKLNQNQLY